MKVPNPRRYGFAAAFSRHKDLAPSSHAARRSFAALTVGALGVVHGDIGTSPLYAMDALFLGGAGSAQTSADVFGGVSLVIWTITLIVAIKYAILVLRAQNDGEGASSRSMAFSLNTRSAVPRCSYGRSCWGQYCCSATALSRPRSACSRPWRGCKSRLRPWATP
jgi:hypothetical protein